MHTPHAYLVKGNDFLKLLEQVLNLVVLFLKQLFNGEVVLVQAVLDEGNLVVVVKINLLQRCNRETRETECVIE